MRCAEILATTLALLSPMGCAVLFDTDVLVRDNARDASDASGPPIRDAAGVVDRRAPFDAQLTPGCGDAGSNVVLCDGFDEGDTWASGWLEEPTGGPERDSTEHVSPPNSLRSRVSGGSDRAGVHLAKTVAVGTYRVLRLSYDVKVGACPGTAVAIMELFTSQGSDGRAYVLFSNEEVGFDWHLAQMMVATGKPTKTSALSTRLPRSAWAHLDISVDVGASQTNVTSVVMLNGEQVLKTTFEKKASEEDVTLKLGANLIKPTADCQVNYDNVVLQRD